MPTRVGVRGVGAVRRSLQLAMGVVVASFVIGTVYSQLRLNREVDALDVATNSGPSIAYLADARDELQLLERHAGDRAVDERARRRLSELLAAYRATPYYPG